MVEPERTKFIPVELYDPLLSLENPDLLINTLKNASDDGKA